MLIARRLAGPLPAYQVRIDREAVRLFADAIGAADDVHRDTAAARAAGHRDILAPPTYLFGIDLERGEVLRQLAEAGADPASCLHVSQEFRYTSSVCAGDTLVLWPSFVVPALPARGTREFVARDTMVRRPDGSPVARLRQVVAVQAGRPAGEAA
ncbi:FAS1-like dehydratase domain-containing protein [Streptomyces alkaliphilus]|uniref:FAS1-like dehydratase domain-containing protein n=1 Tax=Streptomyces alkaliphilus TaxID=1472722 RepID=UPI001562EB02|nr:MaoC family dehydratase N-terminal domain-containing protein [Streptomyces alkaliphilus]